jgi:alpha-glucosidase (family GH31 glycosyl hydrolase)
MTSLLHPPVFESAAPAGNVVLDEPSGTGYRNLRARARYRACARAARRQGARAAHLGDCTRDRGRGDRRAGPSRSLWLYLTALQHASRRPDFAHRNRANQAHRRTARRSDLRSGDTWQRVLQDRATQPYNFGWWDERVYHYVRREPGEMYLGLGERAGSLDRAGHRYQMVNIDAMGYSAKTTDPLYKHIPFYLTWQREVALGYGLFYDTLADCTFDMGRELDNYHGQYRHFIAEHGDLDYYFIASPATPLAAVRRFTWLTGRAALMPKWGLGYSGSTMSYTDAPDAQHRMGEFIERCREHDILCDSFRLSSGYTSIGSKRYVFNWNRDKFPDVDGFVQGYLEHGLRLCANIKPCLLQDHLEFEQTARDRLLIRARSGEPAWVHFWDEVGAYLDFTNPDMIAWWRSHVTEALLRHGIASTWNDNNEFEIWTPDAIARGFGKPYPAREAKVLQTMLMMRASPRRAACARAATAAVSRLTLGGSWDAPLCADLVGRQLHVVGDAALQPQDGPGARAVGRIEHRARHRRISRPGAGRRFVSALDSVRYPDAALKHSLMERRRHRQRTVDAP